MSELIAYYSRAGENYVGGKIKILKIGNTEIVAKTIQNAIGGDLYCIAPTVEYSKDYSECLDEAKADQRRGARPFLKWPPPDMNQYTVLYLGFPNYWGTMPMPLFTFLEASDLAGITIRPFCTHEGSGFGQSLEDIKKLCPATKIEKGLSLHGAGIHLSENKVMEWLIEHETPVDMERKVK